MDLSKLPKLSGEASAEPAPAGAAPGPASASAAPTVSANAVGPANSAAAPAAMSASASPPVAYSVAAPVSFGANVWISLILGLLMLYIGRDFAAFALTTLAGRPYHTGVEWTGGPQTGEVPYLQLQGYTAWTDAAMFLFGLILLLDAVVWALAAIRPGSLRLALLPAAMLTALGTIFNIVVALVLFSSGILPLMSVVAVAVGGWIFFDQWRLLRISTEPLVQTMR